MFGVLATVILDPITAMIGGGAVALFSAQLIQRSPEKEFGRTVLLGAAWGLWWGGTVGWMYFNYPDWMLVYLIDSQKLPLVPTYLLFLVVLVLHGVLAALGVAALVQRKQLGLAWAVVLGIVATNLILMAVQIDQYSHIGTYAEYLAHQAKPMAEVPRAQLGMTVAGLLAAPVGFGVLGVRFFQGRRAARGQG